MKKLQITFSLFIFLLCASHLFAQELVLQGVVIDAKTQQTIPEASILIEGGNVGISTNADGQFLLRV
ncbi:MAG: hypothetical protein EAY75_00955, partial [Bacteroidetes bacterium]